MTSESIEVRLFRWVAIAEAISYVLLLLAMVGKYGFDQEIGVTVMGPIHGVLFLAYLAFVFVVWPKVKWTFTQALIAILLGALPLGTLYVEQRMIPASSEPVTQ